jgi:hypothetical protein
LAVLAVISYSVENSTETTLDLKNPTSTTRKRPLMNLHYLLKNDSVSRSRTARRALQRSKKPSDDWRRLAKPPGRLPNSKKPSLDLKIDITVLEDRPDGPVVEAVNEDAEGMDVNANVDGVNDVEKHADLDLEEDEAEEDASQRDEEAQPIDDAGEGEDDLLTLKEKEMVTKTRNKISRLRSNKKTRTKTKMRMRKSHRPRRPRRPGDRASNHRDEALDVLASIEPKFATHENGYMLRKWRF